MRGLGPCCRVLVLHALRAQGQPRGRAQAAHVQVSRVPLRHPERCSECPGAQAEGEEEGGRASGSPEGRSTVSRSRARRLLAAMG